MNQSVEVATKSVKELDRQVSAFQVRLEDIQSKLEAGKKELARLEAEISEKRDLWHKELGSQNAELTKKRVAVNQEREKLEQDKALFQDEKTALQKEKNAFEREKTDVGNMRKACEMKEALIGQFVRVVKSEAERL